MTLQRSEIVDAALELLNRDGLDGVTVRKVATRLDVHVGGLYWHVKSKQDLFDEMANTMLSRQFATLPPVESHEDWSVWLATVAHDLRQAMLAYRDGGRIVAGARLLRATALARLLAHITQGLRSSGFGDDHARWLCMTVVSYTFGFVIEEQAGPTAETLAHLEQHGPHHPFLQAALDSVNARHPDLDTDFTMGLGYIIVGARASRTA